MEPLLFLVHRIPYPPNKGDKVRSYHLLKFLSERYDVVLGTFIDDPSDLVHVGELRKHCVDLWVGRIQPFSARLRALAALPTGGALSVRYFHSRSLRHWVAEAIERRGIQKCITFSSVMAQYLPERSGLRCIADFVDVDSEKWRQYARSRTWPLSALYRLEADRLLAFERRVSASVDATVFVTPSEVALFEERAPECVGRTFAVANGVDDEHFQPSPSIGNPFPDDEEPIVFTGAMDYWPNVDAVEWYARSVLPTVIARRPKARFYIVGMNPAPAVQSLVSLGSVTVTGRVADTRPYLQHARVVVAPLRVARGIQNKILEAMAMARPVIVSKGCADSLNGVARTEFAVAASAGEFAEQTLALLDGGEADRMGALARARVLCDYAWDRNLAFFDRCLQGGVPPRTNCAPIQSIAQPLLDPSRGASL